MDLCCKHWEDGRAGGACRGRGQKERSGGEGPEEELKLHPKGYGWGKMRCRFT